MDQTSEFRKILQNYCNECTATYYDKPRYSPSPFLMQASDMLKQLLSMEKKKRLLYESYHTQFHKKLTSEDNQMKKIDQEMTLFAVTWTTEVNELKRNYLNDKLYQNNEQSIEHFSTIISYLLLRLQRFTKSLQRMRSLRNRYSLSPYKIHTPMNVSSSIEIPTSITGPTTNSSWKASTPSSSSSTSTTSSQLPKPSFSERYQSEIAPPIKMKEYEQFASKYKEELLYESKQMTIKYHEELQETYNMESTITSLYSMMNDFITVLQSQEDIIIDIHDTSKKTTTYVKETDKELILTIDRSKSYQMTIVSMIIGLSLFLLLLDSLTP